MPSDPSFLPIRANYKALISYQKAECIYDITFFFAHTHLQCSDRTIDQMVQAARSCKQNIVEGCTAASTSKETEIKLLNVAKASLHELLEDYQDYLRTRSLTQWAPSDPRFIKTREVCYRNNASAFYREAIAVRSAKTVANIAIILIHQTDYLLFKQIEAAKAAFLASGGIREQMSRARRAYIGGSGSSNSL